MKAYVSNRKLILHPDGLCERFHAFKQKCICEVGAKCIEVYIPTGFVVKDEVSYLQTDGVVLMDGKHFEVWMPTSEANEKDIAMYPAVKWWEHV